MSTAENNVPFYTQAAILDGYIRDHDPGADPAALEVVISVLSERTDLRKYFFGNRPTPAWVPILWENGFFTEAPSPIEDGEGWTRFPTWEAQEYLLSIAAEVPDFAIKHAMSVRGSAVYVARAMQCVATLAPDAINGVVPGLLERLDDAEVIRRASFPLMAMATSLVQAGYSSALDLFAGLIRPQPNRRAQVMDSGYIANAEAVAGLENYLYAQDSFKALLDSLFDLDGSKLVSILEDALEAALRVESGARAYDTPSSWWRSAIEPSGQNYHHDYKDHILDWLRDVDGELLERDEEAGRVLVNRYLAAGSADIYRRLGLHLVRTHLSLLHPVAAEELARKANFDDTAVHHEFMHLLSDGFPHLSKSETEAVLAIILEGPPERVVEMQDALAGRMEGDEETRAEAYRQHWTLARLWIIKDHLEGMHAREFKRLVDACGEPEHPDYLIWNTGVFSVADVSPLPGELLKEYSPEALLAYAREWEPAPGRVLSPEQVSVEGLGNALAGVLLEDVERYSNVLISLAALRPEYAYAILSQASERMKQDDAFIVAGAVFVDLVGQLLADPYVRASMDRSGNSLMGWRDVRQRMVDMLGAVLEGIGKEDRGLAAQIRDVLILLLDDPDPTQESDRPEEGWHGHGDPITVSLNHVRPSALLHLIDYQVRMLAGVGKETDRQIEGEVRAGLDKALADPSLSCRSVFGRCLMNLYWADKDWVIANLDSIFPDGETGEDRWQYAAAWDAYVLFNHHLYADLFEKLRPRYARAINNITSGYVTRSHLRPIQGMASHALFDFFVKSSNNGENSGSLLHDLLERLGREDRGHVGWALWTTCRERASEGKPWWKATHALWAERAEAAARRNFPSDFDIEIGWFVSILEFVPTEVTITFLWPVLTASMQCIRIGNKEAAAHQAWESLEGFLVRESKSEPQKVIEIYARMHEDMVQPAWGFGDDQARAILTSCAENLASRKMALALIDILGRRGDLRFRDIYERFTQ